MALCSSDENLSDDEIFFGKLSLKEVKKRLLPNNHRQTITCGTETIKVSNDESVSIIETHSEPDIHSVRDTVASLDYSNTSFASRASLGWDVKSTDDSFLKIEKMVTEMCISPKETKKEELDNTLEVVEFILNNAPLHDNKNNITDPIVSEKETEENISKVNDCSKQSTEVTDENVQAANTSVDCKTDIKIEVLHETPSKKPSNLKKHIQNNKIEGKSTPSAEIKQTKEIFKTPKNPILFKNNQLSSAKKTPGKINAFQHITSPVATYIKNCPQVPLLRDVHPKKPLPGTSSIPKIIKNTSNDKVEKENVLLPSIAYRSAKKTKMITIPDKERLPQSPWAKKIASSLPKPVVIKHDHREVNSMKKSMLNHQEDSFANLSLHQADLSVCTQKSAVTKFL
ncbi:unnamed protein product [Euphydryas editha]|uniref:Uncharacterized protein n=1 Tax=Euphydryas editha TaxID=104508 RepID=A0AAU9UX44_EUPED|nr:unnamed protein product [Euphydryas editha]